MYSLLTRKGCSLMKHIFTFIKFSLSSLLTKQSVLLLKIALMSSSKAIRLSKNSFTIKSTKIIFKTRL